MFILLSLVALLYVAIMLVLIIGLCRGAAKADTAPTTKIVPDETSRAAEYVRPQFTADSLI